METMNNAVSDDVLNLETMIINLKAENKKLEKELKITDELLEERQKVLDTIPECQVHGKGCLPKISNWIKESKELMKGKTNG